MTFMSNLSTTQQALFENYVDARYALEEKIKALKLKYTDGQSSSFSSHLQRTPSLSGDINSLKDFLSKFAKAMVNQEMIYLSERGLELLIEGLEIFKLAIAGQMGKEPCSHLVLDDELRSEYNTTTLLGNRARLMYLTYCVDTTDLESRLNLQLAIAYHTIEKLKAQRTDPNQAYRQTFFGKDAFEPYEQAKATNKTPATTPDSMCENASINQINSVYQGLIGLLRPASNHDDSTYSAHQSSSSSSSSGGKPHHQSQPPGQYLELHIQENYKGELPPSDPPTATHGKLRGKQELKPTADRNVNDTVILSAITSSACAFFVSAPSSLPCIFLVDTNRIETGFSTLAVPNTNTIYLYRVNNKEVHMLVSMPNELCKVINLTALTKESGSEFLLSGINWGGVSNSPEATVALDFSITNKHQKLKNVIRNAYRYNPSGDIFTDITHVIQDDINMIREYLRTLNTPNTFFEQFKNTRPNPEQIERDISELFKKIRSNMRDYEIARVRGKHSGDEQPHLIPTQLKFFGRYSPPVFASTEDHITQTINNHISLTDGIYLCFYSSGRSFIAHYVQNNIQQSFNIQNHPSYTLDMDKEILDVFRQLSFENPVITLTLQEFSVKSRNTIINGIAYYHSAIPLQDMLLHEELQIVKEDAAAAGITEAKPDDEYSVVPQNY